MNHHEYAAWERLCEHISHTRHLNQDSAAEALLNETLEHHPQLLYALAHRALALEHALHEALEAIDAMERLQRRERESLDLGIDVCVRINSPYSESMPTNVRHPLNIQHVPHQMPLD